MMLKVDTEFRRGIFFIRLKGRIDNAADLDWINNIVDIFGIRCVVLNIENLYNIDIQTIDYISKYNDKILKSKRYLLLCDANDRLSRLFVSIHKINCEIEAFTLF